MIQKILKKILTALMIVSLVTFFPATYATKTASAAPAYVDTTVTVNKDIPISPGCNGCGSNPIWGHANIADLPANSGVTNINGYITITGFNGASSGTANIIADAQSFSSDWGWTTNSKSSTTQVLMINSINTPTNFNFNFDPSVTILEPHLYASVWEYIYGTVHITSYTYRTFDTSVLSATLGLTPNNYAMVTTSTNGLFRVYQTVTNTTSNIVMANSECILNTTGHIDTSVIPEKTYYYTVTVFINDVSPTITLLNSNIIIPSDAMYALNNTNTIINSYLSANAGVIEDTSGNTVLSVAKLAKASADTASTNAQQAKISADTASQNALIAKSSADTAATNAANANTTLGTSAGVVQDSSGTVLQSARQAVSDINNAQSTLSNQMNNMQSSLSNSFTNIQNYIAPTLTKVSGYNAATATSGTTFNVSLDYSGANEYQVKVDN